MDLHGNGTNGSCTSSCELLTDYYIPDYILKPDSEKVTDGNAPSCPVVVFINSKSGGQLGSSLIKTYRELLNKAQVNRLAVCKSFNTKMCFPFSPCAAALCFSPTLNHVLIVRSTQFFIGF